MSHSDPDCLDPIEALTNNMIANQQETQSDRARFYQAMADLALSQAQMSETHARFQSNIYQRHKALDQQQRDIVEILKLLTNQFKNSN